MNLQLWVYIILKNISILKILLKTKFSNKEIYISHSIETLVKKILVHSYEVKKFICLGTP